MGNARAGCSVLVVEDEAMIAMALEADLQRGGCTVVGPVGRLDRAMQAVAEARFDVALLDVNLAGERVFPVADALERRRIPFAFLTATGPDIMPERFWRHAALRKPYVAKRLLATLARLAGGEHAPAAALARAFRSPAPGHVDGQGGPTRARSRTTAVATRPAVTVVATPPEPAPRLDKPRPPPRRRNAEVRPREHLTHEEVERLVAAAGERAGRHGCRDAAMILLAYRHGLRASELVGLLWSQVDLEHSALRVARLRNGQASVHALREPELRALERLRAVARPADVASVFTTERGGGMTAAAFRKQLAAAARAAGMPFSVHPHMLRHACGFALAHEGRDPRAIQAWLGHKDIRHAARYAEGRGDEAGPA